MSDERREAELARDPREEAFLDALHKRKAIAVALQAGELPCLPGKDGYADTTRAINMVSGSTYHGANLLYLKEHQRANGFPTAEYLTSNQIDKIRESSPDLLIKKGEKSVGVHWTLENKKTGEVENKSARLFNIAQLNKPELVKSWIAENEIAKEERKAAIQTESYKPLEAKEKKSGPEIICNSTDPAKYLGQYLAAVSMGGKFKASPEQGKEFAEKMHDALYAKMGNGHSNPFMLFKICNAAGVECKQVMKELAVKTQEIKQPEQSQGISR